jgi:hypothetical protein
MNDSQACEKSYVLTHLLKGELGFQGFVMSDWLGTHSGVASVLPGLDMTMPVETSTGYNSLSSFYGTNLTVAVPAWRIDDMAMRIMAAFFYVDRDVGWEIHSTGPVLLEKYKQNPNITAILWAGLPGQESGNPIADVLYGRVNPGAKLPFTVGQDRKQCGTDILCTPNAPVPQFNHKEGVFIDYRAFDKHNTTPTYELGYGLSYSTFEYSDLRSGARSG